MQVAVELTVDPAKGHAPRAAGEIARATGAEEGRVMFATLAPDRNPDAEAALRRAPEPGPRRRRNDLHMPEHKVRICTIK